MSSMASTRQARPFVGVASKRTSPARPRAVTVRAIAREDILTRAAGAAAGAVLAASMLASSPALAFSFPGLPSKEEASTGTLPEGDSASSVQKRVMSSDSMQGGGQPDKSDTTLPETSGGSGGGNVPPIAGRSNLTGTAAAPEKAQGDK